MNKTLPLAIMLFLGVILCCSQLDAQLNPSRIFNRLDQWLDEFQQERDNEQRPIGGDPGTWGPPLEQSNQKPGQSKMVHETMMVWNPGYLDSLGNWNPGAWREVVVEREIFVVPNYPDSWEAPLPIPNPLGPWPVPAEPVAPKLSIDSKSSFTFEKPEWVRISELPDDQRPMGFVVTHDPQIGIPIKKTIRLLLQTQRQQEVALEKIHYLGMAVTQPEEQTPRNLIVETRDLRTGQKEFWDIVIRPTETGGWSMPSAQALPMITASPPSFDIESGLSPSRPNPQRRLDYERPAWVVTRPVPGGIFAQDVDDPSVQQDLQYAKEILQHRAGGNLEVKELLHAGRQSVANGFRCFFVIRTSDNDVMLVEYYQSLDGVSATIRSIKR